MVGIVCYLLFQSRQGRGEGSGLGLQETARGREQRSEVRGTAEQPGGRGGEQPFNARGANETQTAQAGKEGGAGWVGRVVTKRGMVGDTELESVTSCMSSKRPTTSYHIACNE